MTKLSKAALIPFIFCVSATFAAAQTPPPPAVKEPPKAAEQPVKPATAATELNGYKQAAWGITKDEVKTALNTEFAPTDPKTSVTELPWELMHLAGISESDPDDLLGTDLQWFLGERQDTVLGFYKDRFFFYTATLDNIIPVSEYEKKLTANHGTSTRDLSFQNTDPAEKKVTGSYAMKLWEKKKTTIVLGTEKLFPTAEPEISYEITYISAEIFGEFRDDFTQALNKKKEAEKKQNTKAFEEQKKRALEVIQ